MDWPNKSQTKKRDEKAKSHIRNELFLQCGEVCEMKLCKRFPLAMEPGDCDTTKTILTEEDSQAWHMDFQVKHHDLSDIAGCHVILRMYVKLITCTLGEFGRM